MKQPARILLGLLLGSALMAGCRGSGVVVVPPKHGHLQVWDTVFDAVALDPFAVPAGTMRSPVEVRLHALGRNRYSVSLYGDVEFFLFDPQFAAPLGFLLYPLESFNGGVGNWYPQHGIFPQGAFWFWGGRIENDPSIGDYDVELSFYLVPHGRDLASSSHADLHWSASLSAPGGWGYFPAMANLSGVSTVAVRLD